jgi:hypothetical protein
VYFNFDYISVLWVIALGGGAGFRCNCWVLGICAGQWCHQLFNFGRALAPKILHTNFSGAQKMSSKIFKEPKKNKKGPTELDSKYYVSDINILIYDIYISVMSMYCNIFGGTNCLFS